MPATIALHETKYTGKTFLCMEYEEPQIIMDENLRTAALKANKKNAGDK